MKKIVNYILAGAVVASLFSCEKYLDINENPNNPIAATPQTVLPQAITAAAATANGFNISMGSISGMVANAGGFSGFGALITYEYTSSSFTGLWSNTMDNNIDFKYVIDNTRDDPKLAFFTSVSRILKALNFARLVDQYNDIPYSEALQGKDNTTPAYDKAEDIYKDLVKELSESIDTIQLGVDANDAQAGAVTEIEGSFDPLFGGDMERWMKFANTIKLRLLIKMASVPELKGYATAEFGKLDLGLGFLEKNALVNPGYIKEAGKAAPIFVSRGYQVDGGQATTSRIASIWMLGFYDGGKLIDPYRGSVIYQGFPETEANQLGIESDAVPEAPSDGTVWAAGVNEEGDPDADANALGVCKGYTQGQPIMLAAESYFLQAEAYLNGYLSGDAKTAFENGIEASFDYLYRDANGSLQTAVKLDATADPVLDTADNEIEYGLDSMLVQYYADNAGDYRVDWSAATTNEQKLEAIITQKYIALNMVNNDEAYNEYRRTNYPKTVLPTSDPLNTFASTRSTSTRPDKLLGRLLYPNFEFATNAGNVPDQDISERYTGLIFWEIN